MGPLPPGCDRGRVARDERRRCPRGRGNRAPRVWLTSAVIDDPATEYEQVALGGRDRIDPMDDTIAASVRPVVEVGHGDDARRCRETIQPSLDAFDLQVVLLPYPARRKRCLACRCTRWCGRERVGTHAATSELCRIIRTLVSRPRQAKSRPCPRSPVPHRATRSPARGRSSATRLRRPGCRTRLPDMRPRTRPRA